MLHGRHLEAKHTGINYLHFYYWIVSYRPFPHLDRPHSTHYCPESLSLKVAYVHFTTVNVIKREVRHLSNPVNRHQDLHVYPIHTVHYMIWTKSGQQFHACQAKQTTSLSTANISQTFMVSLTENIEWNSLNYKIYLDQANITLVLHQPQCFVFLPIMSHIYTINLTLSILHLDSCRN